MGCSQRAFKFVNQSVLGTASELSNSSYGSADDSSVFLSEFTFYWTFFIYIFIGAEIEVRLFGGQSKARRPRSISSSACCHGAAAGFRESNVHP